MRLGMLDGRFPRAEHDDGLGRRRGLISPDRECSTDDDHGEQTGDQPERRSPPHDRTHECRQPAERTDGEQPLVGELIAHGTVIHTHPLWPFPPRRPRTGASTEAESSQSALVLARCSDERRSGPNGLMLLTILLTTHVLTGVDSTDASGHRVVGGCGGRWHYRTVRSGRRASTCCRAGRG